MQLSDDYCVNLCDLKEIFISLNFLCRLRAQKKNSAVCLIENVLSRKTIRMFHIEEEVFPVLIVNATSVSGPDCDAILLQLWLNKNDKEVQRDGWIRDV